jgi:DNA polymerase I
LHDPRNQSIIGVSLAFSETEVYFVPITDSFTTEELCLRIRDFMKSSDISAFHVKELYPFFGESEQHQFFDIQLAAYLLNPLKNDYQIDDIANEYLDWILPDEKSIYQKLTISEAFEQNKEQISEYSCSCAAICFKAYQILKTKLQDMQDARVI